MLLESVDPYLSVSVGLSVEFFKTIDVRVEYGDKLGGYSSFVFKTSRRKDFLADSGYLA